MRRGRGRDGRSLRSARSPRRSPGSRPRLGRDRGAVGSRARARVAQSAGRAPRTPRRHPRRSAGSALRRSSPRRGSAPSAATHRSPPVTGCASPIGSASTVRAAVRAVETPRTFGPVGNPLSALEGNTTRPDRRFCARTEGTVESSCSGRARGASTWPYRLGRASVTDRGGLLRGDGIRTAARAEQELARIESALAEARAGRGRFVVIEGPGRDRQDGAARGGADGGGGRAGCACSGRGGPSWSAISPSGWRASSSSRRWPRRRSSSAPICCRAPPGVAAGLLGLPGARRCARARSRRASIRRSRSCTASTGCARTWPRAAPLCIVVDDAHWADAPSLRYLAFLLTRLEELDVALVVATRPREAGTDAELLATVTTDPSAEVIRLPPLTRTAVAELVGVEARPGLRIRCSSMRACARRAGRRSSCASSWTR